jgi:hypothetical protein
MGDVKFAYSGTIKPLMGTVRSNNGANGATNIKDRDKKCPTLSICSSFFRPKR